MIFYTEKIESIAVALNNFDIDDFKKNHRNNISFLCKDKKYYRALLSAKKYLRRYKKVDKYLGKVYRSIADIYGESGDIELAIVNYDQSIYLLKNIKIKKN
jgi:tetratricopeptide (TPR) repeat protein